MTLEPQKSWPMLEARLAEEVHPQRRRNLAIVLEHLRAESLGDLAAVMRTLADHPAHRVYGSDDPRLNPEGYDAVRGFYAAWIAGGGDLIDYDIERLVVDDHALCSEGPLRMPFEGRLLLTLGHDVDDPDAYYLFEARLAVVWRISEDGRIEEERTYTVGNGFRDIGARKLRLEDLHGF